MKLTKTRVVDGFLTDKIQGLDTTGYVYSSRGELLQVDLPDGTVIEYIHDPLGRRIAKKVDGVIVEKYLWQGLTRLLAVYDGSDALLMRFEYAVGRTPISMASGGATYYLAYDQVGSLKAVFSSTKTLVKQVDYDTFGNVIGDTNPTFSVPFGFAGGLHDRDTGLVRFGYRDYDPDVGRWTAKDPIGFAGGDTDLYGYCLNDPVNWVDPKGLWEMRYGGSGFLFDFSSRLYDSKTGKWFSTTTDIGSSTTLVGGGVSFVFDTGLGSDTCAGDGDGDGLKDLQVYFGYSKYLGIGFEYDLSKVYVNIGMPSKSLPNLNFGTSLGSIDWSK